MKRSLLPLPFFLCLFAFSAVIFQPSSLKADTLHVTNSITPEQMVQQVLIGGGIVTSNITYTGANISRGKFWGGPGNIGIRDGIILTSGDINKAKGPNNSGSAGTNTNTGGDPDLNQIAGTATFDACVLEFDFIPQSNVVSFRYVFASEEYHEYVNQFNDAFGFFISGPGISGPFSNNSKNIALIPLSTTPVSINTVNYGNPYGSQCTNCTFFVNNMQNFTQYDAFTTVLTAWANVIPCETYHIKLAIGDGVDHVYDSGVFLEAGSFSSVGISSDVAYTQAPNVDFLIEGCSDASITFTLSVQPAENFYLPIMISGSAINGIDYEQIPDSIFFPQGYSQVSTPVITIADGLTEWFETIQIVYNSSLCSIDYDTIFMVLHDYKLAIQTTPDTTINCNTSATIRVKNVNGYGPYSYNWSTGDTTAAITVSPLMTTTYYVTVGALCDSMVTDSVRVIVDGPKSNAGPDVSIPYGTTGQLQGSASQGSGEYTYSWSPPELLVDPTVPNPMTVQMEQTTQFTLTVTDNAGGCQDNDQMMLFVFGGPLGVGPVANPSSICPGESAQLYSYASGGSENYSYQWSSNPPGFNSDLPDPIVQPLATTTYYVVVDDGYNMVTGSVTVNVSALPVPEAGPNDTIWHGTYGYLFGSAAQGSGNYSWSWQPADKLINPYAQNPITVKLYETTLFRLQVTDNVTGCVSEGEDLVTVVVNGGPLSVTADVTDPLICRGETTQLHALPSGGAMEYEYQWRSDPAGFSSNEPSPFINPVITTTYFVEVSDGFNAVEASVEVVISSVPFVNLGPDMVTCPYDTVVLSVNIPGMTYYWSNGSVGNSITVGTTGIGFDLKKIWVQVQNSEGCIGTDTILVSFDFAECTGVSENADQVSLLIYPNPSTGLMNIEWMGIAGKVALTLTDLQGRVLYTQEVHSPPTGEYKGTLQMREYQRGIYLLKIQSPDKWITRKILLK